MTDEYKTGYGKPPKKSQFKPGHSGNPKGRPKGSRNTATIMNDVLLKSTIRVNADGKERKICRLEAAMHVLSEKAFKERDWRAAAKLVELAHKYASLIAPREQQKGGVLLMPAVECKTSEEFEKIFGDLEYDPNGLDPYK